jgi:hypothetical protein
LAAEFEEAVIDADVRDVEKRAEDVAEGLL